MASETFLDQDTAAAPEEDETADGGYGEKPESPDHKIVELFKDYNTDYGMEDIRQHGGAELNVFLTRHKKSFTQGSLQEIHSLIQRLDQLNKSEVRDNHMLRVIARSAGTLIASVLDHEKVSKGADAGPGMTAVHVKETTSKEQFQREVGKIGKEVRRILGARYKKTTTAGLQEIIKLMESQDFLTRVNSRGPERFDPKAFSRYKDHIQNLLNEKVKRISKVKKLETFRVPRSRSRSATRPPKEKRSAVEADHIKGMELPPVFFGNKDRERRDKIRAEKFVRGLTGRGGTLRDYIEYDSKNIYDPIGVNEKFLTSRKPHKKFRDNVYDKLFTNIGAPRDEVGRRHEAAREEFTYVTGQSMANLERNFRAFNHAVISSKNWN